MSESLQFIPMIARALEQPDPQAALAEAFERIRDIGQDPDHGPGFAQFQRFMEIASRTHMDPATAVDEIVLELALELATGAFDGPPDERAAVLGLVMSRPEWRAEFEELKAVAVSTLQRASQVELNVEREGRPVGTVALSETSRVASLGGIAPGRHRLKLETGRVVWEGDLTERDLIWTTAHPSRPLELAADTGELGSEPTRVESLLGGDLLLRIFPGLESGRLEIARRARDAS